MLQRVKKNDVVRVISGRDRGKEGRVVSVDVKKHRVLVKDVNLVTRHVKPRRQGEQGGIKQEEAFIGVNKVMPVCPACKKPCRVQTKLREGDDAKKMRMCHRCHEGF